MGDIKGNFEFILRGTDSLAYKWIKEIRGSGIFEEGVNIWGLADYFFQTLFLNKIFTDLYSTYTDFASEFRMLNSFDTEHIIGFNEKVKIPITHTTTSIAQGSAGGFGDVVSQIESNMTIGGQQFKEILSKDELIEFCVNIYHIFYDNRSRNHIRGESYQNIVDHPYLYFGDNSSLSFITPASLNLNITASTKREDKEEIQLPQNTTTPEETENEIKKVVFLDPGHGGSDSGNIGINKDWADLSIKNYTQLQTYFGDNTLIKESTIVLDYANKLQELLSDADIIVEMIRSSDTTTELSSRSSTVNNKLSSYSDEDKIAFISLHTNAVGQQNEETIKEAKITYLEQGDVFYYAYTSSTSTNTWVPVPNTGASGGRTYIYNGSNVHSDSESFQNKIATELGFTKREANYSVLRNTTDVPGILIELGFSTNLSNLQYMIDNTNRDELCGKIKDAVVDFFA